MGFPDRIERGPRNIAGPPRAAALAVTLSVAAACWIVALWRTNGMDMGVATTLGPLPVFLAGWAVMMAAMMLPGAAPAVVRRVEETGRARDVAAFLGGYLAIWVLLGIAVYACYRPHGTAVAGEVAILAAAYELTPAKRYLRRRCHGGGRSGLWFGLWCAGSGLGLTALLVALGPMNAGWMAVIACLGLAEKLWRPTLATDLPVALAIAGLGVLILLAPDAVPGLTPSM